MSWISVPSLTAIAIAVLLVPGLIATNGFRGGFVARVAMSAAAGVASLGVAGIAFSSVGVPFAPWQPLIPATILGILVWALRRRKPDEPPTISLVFPAGLVSSWVIAVIVVAVVAFAAVPSPERISQTYDNLFHLSGIAHILDQGDASSLTLRTLIETDRTWSFYPSAWHSLVAITAQLSGASIPVSVNATWIAVCAVVWLPGVAWLAQVLLPRFDPGVVALVALPLGAAFGAMPYGLLTWGTLYPTFLATALLPAAIAFPLAAWRRFGGRRMPLALVLGGTAMGALAVFFAQPRVLVSWALILMPFAVAEGVRLFRRAFRVGGRGRRVAAWILGALVLGTVLAAAIGFWYLVFRLGLFERPLEDRLGGPQAKASQSVLTGLGQVLFQSWPLGVGGAVTFPAIILGVAVMWGLVVAARTRGMRWVVVAYVLVAVLFALAAGSDDVFAKLATALWYKDRYRLSSILPVIGVALATLGILSAARLTRRPPLRTATAVGAAWLALVTAVAGFGAVTQSVSHVFRLPDVGADDEVVSAAQITFMEQVEWVVPSDQRLLGDPWDGSALSQLYAQREPVFPHVNGQWDAERQTLAWRLQDIETDPAVCAALDALRVRYVLYHPHAFAGGDPAGNHFIGVHTAVDAGLFTVVATDGDSTLYRIDQCGPLPS